MAKALKGNLSSIIAGRTLVAPDPLAPAVEPAPSPQDLAAFVASPTTARVRVSGKFFELDGRKWYLKGLTYGPFAPNSEGLFLPERARLRGDFQQIRELGANCLRLYHRPPTWLLDTALEHDLRIFVDVPWEKHRCFFEDWSAQQAARDEVRRTARELGSHPALFAISVANELPTDIVRFYGRERVARFVDNLIDTARQEAPDCPITFASFPPTEYLRPTAGDFVCFNVYLENQVALSAYLDRLQHLAGDGPLILGEFGADSIRHGEAGQTAAIEQHVEKVFHHGLAGSFVFSFTDDWFTGGHQIEDWAFGVTRRDRSAKPAAAALKRLWSLAPRVKPIATPKVSVVVCSCNGARTLRECLASLEQLNYPDYEVILVDDGSTDDTQAIAADFPRVRNIRQENRGLSVARNVGAEAAQGEIVAYTDSDCVADPEWLFYLVDAMQRQGVKAIGGPNVPPPGDGWTAHCVAASPGGPSHVMLDDQRAEHVPGCNMAYDRQTLLKLGGFDPQFRQAGDDVDICWRLLDAGIDIGYAASALVWHHRRNTIRAYLKQQKGYGRSEAMLMVKHRHRFNRVGASLWKGVIYGEGAVGLPLLPSLVYHGRFGAGLFQCIYARNTYSRWGLFTLLEWHATAAGFVLLFPLVPQLALVSLTMWALTLTAAWRASHGSNLPARRPWWFEPVVFTLHLLQPIVRGWHRYCTYFHAKEIPRTPDSGGEVLLPALRRVGWKHDAYWTSNENLGREHLLHALEDEARRQGWRGVFDDYWSEWDVLLTSDRWFCARLATATEELGWPKRFTRARVTLVPTLFAQIKLGVFLVAATGATIALHGNPIALLVIATLAASILAMLWIKSRKVLRAVEKLLARAGRIAKLEPFGQTAIRENASKAATGVDIVTKEEGSGA
jgi:glycosyltransferase involved in cell wall biosynthesis